MSDCGHHTSGATLAPNVTHAGQKRSDQKGTQTMRCWDKGTGFTWIEGVGGHACCPNALEVVERKVFPGWGRKPMVKAGCCENRFMLKNPGVWGEYFLTEFVRTGRALCHWRCSVLGCMAMLEETLQKNSSVGSLKEGTKFPLQDLVMPCMGDLNLKLGCVWSCNREE